MRTYEVRTGCRIDLAINEALAIARSSGDTVKFEFNGTSLMARPTSTAKELSDVWWSVQKKQEEAYELRAKRDVQLLKAVPNMLALLQDCRATMGGHGIALTLIKDIDGLLESLDRGKL